ncbi:MAG: glyoxalase [Flavobacteriales bacterium]
MAIPFGKQLKHKMLDIKKQIRPMIFSIKDTGTTSIEEKFQNTVLRPIIKLQHELILCYFEQFLKRKKSKLKELSDLQKTEVIQNMFSRDIQLKTDLRGLIIGLFTLEEYQQYLNLSSQLNKRINAIIQQRVKSCYINS